MTVVTGQAAVEAARTGRTAEDYVRAAMADLTALRTSAQWGWLEIGRRGPTAAFSRRDTLAPGYGQASEVVRRHGFEPVVRPAGGRLAAYHEGALILDVVGRHPSPSSEIDRRFHAFSDAIASALRTLGVDARVGPVPGEYCPGRFSVNAAGRTKLAGTAQRLTGGSFLLSAVVLVSDPEPIRTVLTEAYAALEVPWTPASVGCVADDVGSVTVDDVRSALLAALAELLPLGSSSAGLPGDDLRIPLSGCWQPLR